MNERIYEALGNELNENIMNTTFEKIEHEKNEILQKLLLSEEKHIELLNKLNDYRFCSDIDDITTNSKICWISLLNVDKYNDVNLKYGTVIKIYETDENINIVYFIGKRIFTIKFSECLIFKKLTEDEELLLRVIESL
jgi:hypothetical protein